RTSVGRAHADVVRSRSSSAEDQADPMTDNPVDEQQADLRISAEGQSLRLAKRGAGARTDLSRGVTGRGDVQVRRRDNFPTDGPDDERTRGRQRWHARRQA